MDSAAAGPVPRNRPALSPARASLTPRARTSESNVRLLLALARVWGEAKYFHPALGRPTINWDSVGTVAIRAVEQTRTPGEFAAAVAAMLAPLHDPVTRVVPLATAAGSAPAPIRGAPSPTTAAGARPPSATWSAESVLVFTVGSAPGTLGGDSARRALGRLSEPAARARRVVVDLRGTAAASADLSRLLARTRLDRALLDRPLCGLAPRRRRYVGFPAPDAFTPSAGWREPDAPCFPTGSTAAKQGVVFLADSASAIPTIVPAMQAAGLASVVGIGPVTDAPLVALDTIPVVPGVGVQLRLAAFPACSGAEGRLADTTLTPSSRAQSDPTLEVARAFTARPPRARTCPTDAPPAATRPSAQTSPDTALPTREWRVLAAFEIYTAIRVFDPHTALIAGQNWDSVVTANLPVIADAATPRAYLAAVSKLLAALNDGHAMLPPSRLLKLFGYAYPPLNVRLVEGRLVVVDNFDSSAAPGVHRGDVVLRVDGTDALTRFADVRQYVPGSTPASRDARASIFFLAGPEGSTATLVVGDAHGTRTTVTAPRRTAYLGPVFNPGSGPVLRLLPGNVGYADLSRLPPTAVDSMFERFRAARALILDVRGYPQGTHPGIARRLARREVVAARLRVPVVDAPEPWAPDSPVPGMTQSTRAFEEVTQRVVPDGRSPYPGRVYVLMDERSISQSEQAALFYKVTGRATLVGSNTAGANGDLTTFTVPGGVGAAFTDVVVHAPDGTPMQGVGLTPDVRVGPTVAGVRAGRDEVLDCALRLATGAARRCGHAPVAPTP